MQRMMIKPQDLEVPLCSDKSVSWGLQIDVPISQKKGLVFLRIHFSIPNVFRIEKKKYPLLSPFHSHINWYKTTILSGRSGVRIWGRFRNLFLLDQLDPRKATSSQLLRELLFDDMNDMYIQYIYIRNGYDSKIQDLIFEFWFWKTSYIQYIPVKNWICYIRNGTFFPDDFRTSETPKNKLRTRLQTGTPCTPWPKRCSASGPWNRPPP